MQHPSPFEIFYADQLAKPGDEDLSFYAEDSTVTSLVVLEQECVISLASTAGEIATEAGPLQFDGDGILETQLIIQLHRLTPDAFKQLAFVLDGWYVNSTSLKVCAAPGKMMLLMEDDEVWIPIPGTGAGPDLVVGE